MNKVQYISEFIFKVNIDVFLPLNEIDNFVKAIQTANPNKCRPQ